MRMLIALLVMLASTTGCSRLAFGIANWGTEMPDVRALLNQAYGTEPLQRLDIYSPKENPKPVVLLYAYGGGWNGGNKEKYRFVAHRFTREGYHVVIPDYRKFPQVTFPAFVEDTAAAIAYVKTRFADAQIILMGHSAGAYNVVMALADPAYLRAHGLDANAVDGVIGISGPYNFTPGLERWKQTFNNMDDYTPMHVNSYVNRPLPPMLLLHGSDDPIVSGENAEALEAALTQVNSPVQRRVYEGAGHFDIVASFTLDWPNKPPTELDSIAFIESLRKTPE